MILDVATPANRIAAVVFLCLSVPALKLALRWRWSKPPFWVADYRGLSSPALTLLWLAVAFLGGSIATLMQGYVPFALFEVFGLTFVIGLPLWFLGMLVWFPRFLTPLWYQRACKAGVDHRSPQAVQTFRELPVETQKRLAKTRGALPDGRDPQGEPE